jgi:hypothetical protein
MPRGRQGRARLRWRSGVCRTSCPRSRRRQRARGAPAGAGAASIWHGNDGSPSTRSAPRWRCSSKTIPGPTGAGLRQRPFALGTAPRRRRRDLAPTSLRSTRPPSVRRVGPLPRSAAAS